MMRTRVPLLLFLGLVFLASVSVSFGIAPKKLCVQRCNRLQQCKIHCRPEETQDEEGGKHPQPQPQPPHQHEDEDESEQPPSYPHSQQPYPKVDPEQHRPYPQPPHKKEHEEGQEDKPRPYPRPPYKKKHDDEDETEQYRPYPQPPHKKEHDDEDETEQYRPYPQPPHKKEHDDEDETEQYRPYPQPPHKKERKYEKDQEDEPYPYPYPHQQKQKEQDEEQDEDKSRKNPFYFSSKRFRTLFKNQYGRIRLLQRFDQRSETLENLGDYRILDYNFKPNALFLPHHADSELLLVVVSGRAILTLVNPDDRDSYNLKRGDSLRILPGTTYYLANSDDNETLRVVALAKPVNKPGRFESFFLSSTQDQQSYLQGFSQNILEASYNAQYEEIKRVLFGEELQGQQSLEEGVIVQAPKEQIQELRRHAKSSSRKTISSKDEPFNPRNQKPIYSNNLGRFYEITPEKNPQLREMDISLSSVDINQGALLLPHYNSKAIVILAVTEGKAKVELVGLKEQQDQDQQQEEQETTEVQRYEAELSQNNILVVPAAYPFAVKATSNLNFLAIGINAENNQRNFLAGDKDNLISQIPRQVQERSFPGSPQQVEKLINNQKESHFADAQPQLKEEERSGRKGPLSSILGAVY